jgi:iron complex transport system ATP-binding protein
VSKFGHQPTGRVLPGRPAWGAVPECITGNPARYVHFLRPAITYGDPFSLGQDFVSHISGEIQENGTVSSVRLDAFSVCHKYGIIVAVDNVSVSLESGEFVGILGPNGSGKTTLLRVLAGALKPSAGTVLLDGEEVHKMRPKLVAKKVAVVAQNGYIPFPFSVLEIVMMGREPHMGRFARESPRDMDIVAQAMAATGVTHLAERSVLDLSYGERQRVIVAKALAQEPGILLLDEPTSHLDPGYRMEIMDILKSLSRRKNIGVMAVLHDVNLASEYSDRLIMLNQGKKVAEGIPQEVIMEEIIENVYGVRAVVRTHPVVNCPQVMLVPGFKEGQVEGEPRED